MSFGEVVTQALLVVAALGAIGYVWALEGRDRWRELLTDRFLYGVPWGTLVSIVGVVAFYLFAQSGLDYWNDPVTVAFRSWSYNYLPGMLTSGFAHASPDHLIGNLVATVVLAPLAEYAWGHYPPGDDDAEEAAEGYRYPPPADATPGTRSAGGASADDGWLTRPGIRAFVLFPAAVFVVSILTSVFALGWSLGFSGTVFAFGGFAVVLLPLTSIVAMLAIGGVGILYQSLTEPVLRVTADPGAPGPPAWAGVNVQAHMLGFLVGVLLGFALLHARDRRPLVGRVFLAALIFGLSRRLWLWALSSDDTYVQYRGIGLVFLLALTTLITAVAVADDEPLVAPDSRLATVGRIASGLWLGVVALTVAAAGFETGWNPAVVVPTVVLLTAIGLPALLPFLPDDRYGSPVSKRAALLSGLILVTAVVALPSLAGNVGSVDGDSVPDGAVAVEDYRVAYAEDAAHGRIDSTDSGVIVVSERREIWIDTVSKQQLSHEGNTTIPLGGVGWRTPVEVERTGWEVLGNESVYAVDLTVAGERTRSFASAPQRANALIANHTVSLAPVEDGFEVTVLQNGTTVGEALVPDRNGTATVGPLRFAVQPDEDTLALFATADGTRVEVARKETY